MQASLHAGSRVTCPASTSGRDSLRPTPQQHRYGYLQRQRPSAACNESQGFRFKHTFKPQESGDKAAWMSWPLADASIPNSHTHQQQQEERIQPEELWQPQGAAGSALVGNPYAQQFRIQPAGLPVPVSLPGTEYWDVEMFRNYSSGWPSIQWDKGKLRVNLGFLGPVDDPKAVPFFFYKGLEQVRYTWGDRAFQLAYAAAYIGVHAFAFSCFWVTNPALALALGYNWARGTLSPAKWGLLLVLASSGRLWLYYTFQVAKALDGMLEKLFPPIRTFFWANFTLWMFYLVLSPSYWPVVPLGPFMPGAAGPYGRVF